MPTRANKFQAGTVYIRRAQEALRNAQKHSRATQILVEVSYQPSEVLDMMQRYDVPPIEKGTSK